MAGTGTDRARVRGAALVGGPGVAVGAADRVGRVPLPARQEVQPDGQQRDRAEHQCPGPHGIGDRRDCGRLDDGNWLLLATEAREQAHADLCAWHARAWHTHDERMRACGELEYEELAERHCDLVRVLSCHG